ncbi:MAG: PASTA domain-containing protein [Clostridia bacterium]|nr:PASTA domain-containing protein [Clostridia bacterium]
MKKIIILILTVFLFLLISCKNEPTVSPEAQMVETPNLIGKTEEEALSILQNLGLNVIRKYKISDLTEDAVIEQDTKAGTYVEVGTSITIVTSVGPIKPLLTLENCYGVDYEKAKLDFEKIGLKTKVVYEYNYMVPQGSIIRTEPRGRTVLTNDTVVTVYVSKGIKPEYIMPDFVGKDLSEASAFFYDNDINFAVFEEYNNSVGVGCIIKTNPQADTVIYGGVAVYISKGKMPE